MPAPSEPDAEVDTPSSSPPSAACVPARSSERIPARTVATSGEVRQRDKVVYVSELFRLFNSNCGGCHAGLASNGNFNLTEGSFSKAADARIVDRIRSDDLTRVMPRPAQPYSQRPQGDAVRQLADWVELYLQQGSPGDSFIVPAKQQDATVVSPFHLALESGRDLTNIGSCIPVAAIVGRNTLHMAERDALFAGLKKSLPGNGTPAERIGLPPRLEQTDLVTLDTEQLAHDGVIAYAPGYPLWSDGARKLRQVRVPLGKSIRFDAKQQIFDIPENTRFYKTFLKQVRQLDGSVRWRKVETRLIVARHDLEKPDGTHQFTSLFGTYEWNDDETEATLHTLPQRNGEPFGDHLFPVEIDEVKRVEVLAERPKKPSSALLKAQAMRTYAVPSVDRCVQCHIGSPTHDFVLGFFPMQIDRLPIGEEGVIEPSGPDELNQLQRLIDYGVITGMSSPNEVVRLSKSQGARAPRNDYELEAQSYLIGNCAHCHNPRGFTTVNNPLLAATLDFLPSADGGIFQFDLQKTSPRIFRESTEIAYITPSLFDGQTTVRKGYSDDTPLGNGNTFRPASAILAPWRSLIYRNVDTPFSYDDFALYPHMPMNVPGFDCRAPRILGDWMVSIPSRRKHPELNADLMCVKDERFRDRLRCVDDVKDGASGEPSVETSSFDGSPQPFEEVRVGDADYADAVIAAQRRLGQYHGGVSFISLAEPPISRYTFCPDTTDILDPFVTESLDATAIVPRSGPTEGPVLNADGTEAMLMDGVPNHPHWVSTDSSDPPPPWFARGGRWVKELPLPHDFGLRPAPSETVPLARYLARQRAVELLVPSNGAPPLGLTDEFRRFALSERPMGLWDETTKKCPPSASITDVASVPAELTRRWKKWERGAVPREVPVAPSDHVYAQVAGQAVYNQICVNCHGVQFDSRGRLADTLLNLSGGNARVANFTTGFFGDAGRTRASTFEPAARSGLNGPIVDPLQLRRATDDWSARYVAWMGLGGTQATLPTPIINLVGNTPFLGESRKGGAPRNDTANMLEVARILCARSLPLGGNTTPFSMTQGWFEHWDYVKNERKPAAKDTPYPSLMPENGDAALWLELCAQGNPAPVREVDQREVNAGTTNVIASMYKAADYQQVAGALVGDFFGSSARSLRSDTVFPWCRKPPEDDSAKEPGVPYCPRGLTRMTLDEQETWALRGAVNAGFAVFLFLDSMSKGELKPKPDYTRCDLVAQPQP